MYIGNGKLMEQFLLGFERAEPVLDETPDNLRRNTYTCKHTEGAFTVSFSPRRSSYDRFNIQ